MISCIGHNILSPLANGSEANYRAVMAGETALRLYTDRFASIEPCYASLFADPQSFVDLCIRSAEEAIRQANIAADDRRVIFILSTTKGDNLDLLTPAQTIVRHFGNPNAPIVVSNACTSGVCAQLTAMRLLNAGLFDTAIVIGCDLQTPFIISGFQSFKALSQEACRPFDAERQGLNLGEAAATIIWSTRHAGRWHLLAGSNHNDANHISGPSRTGEGLYRCINDLISASAQGANAIAMLSVHGTATNYNDEMESIAIHRAGLDATPICALKGYYGHTMGAAGVVETIISLLCLEHQQMPAAKGFEKRGTSYALNISNEPRAIHGQRLIKMLSGFGGTNAAILLECE